MYRGIPIKHFLFYRSPHGIQYSNVLDLSMIAPLIPKRTIDVYARWPEIIITLKLETIPLESIVFEHVIVSRIYDTKWTLFSLVSIVLVAKIKYQRLAIEHRDNSDIVFNIGIVNAPVWIVPRVIESRETFLNTNIYIRNGTILTSILNY